MPRERDSIKFPVSSPFWYISLRDEVRRRGGIGLSLDAQTVASQSNS